MEKVLSLLTNSSGKVVPSFCFSIGCRFLVGESLKKKKKREKGKTVSAALKVNT